MGKWLNTYATVESPTGKQVNLFVDLAPWRDNPWITITEAARRYRNGANGEVEIQLRSKTGEWDPVNPVDLEYWQNYVADIEKKRKQTKEKNLFEKMFKLEGELPEQKNGVQVINWLEQIPEDKCGGKVAKAAKGEKFTEGLYNMNKATQEPNLRLRVDENNTPDAGQLQEIVVTPQPVVRADGSRYLKIGDGKGSYLTEWYEAPSKKSNNIATVYVSRYSRPGYDKSLDLVLSKKGQGAFAWGNPTNAEFESIKKGVYPYSTSEYVPGFHKEGGIINEDLITAIKACGGKMKKKK